MTQKIAVAVVHGMGRPQKDFHVPFRTLLEKQMTKELGVGPAEAAAALAVRPVEWARAVDADEEELFRRMEASGPMRWKGLREFVVHFLADAIAYQATPWSRDTYDAVHAAFAKTLHDLAEEAGPRAPLCVVAHSLGSVISSNFLYDLQHDFGPDRPRASKKRLVAAAVEAELDKTPLEQGRTFSHFYTCGSTLPLWALRSKNPEFGLPVKVPSPGLAGIHPRLVGEWVNFYDRHDILGYPFQRINAAYGQVVARDEEINVGPALWSWTPKSHTYYFGDRDFVGPIATSLATAWRQVNEGGAATAPGRAKPRRRAP